MFLRLFIETTAKDSDRVHSADLRDWYLRYCTVTNSTPMGRKAFTTFIENETNRLRQETVRIGEKVSTGYIGVLFRKDKFDETLTLLNDARTTNKPIFQTLLDKYPDLRGEYATFSATFRAEPVALDVNPTNPTRELQENYNKTIKPHPIVAIVVKYSNILVKGNEEGDGGAGSKGQGENKSTTKTTKTTNWVTDADSDVVFLKGFDPTTGKFLVHEVTDTASEVKEKIVETTNVAEEFLLDGGQASLERFLKEFSEAGAT